jgi:valyl-tRNA synthetase
LLGPGLSAYLISTTSRSSSRLSAARRPGWLCSESPPPMLEKSFRPEEAESRLYAAWEKAGAFAAGRRPEARPYTIVIPPPNVTGSLHIGHALNNTLQDILVRFERMRGRDVLWQPGTDHAGIATQMVVERQLALEQNSRQKLGREKFIERVWNWKAESGGTIIKQLRRLGCSCDWSRERFTMDEGLSAAVTKVFVDLYKKGLIYKDKRLVNWDPKLLTAISDLEVVQKEVKSHLWHFRYPIEGETDKFIVVATTRPETMLGDTAVAVHPDDERYKNLVGKFVILPLVGRRIPIVADDYADPETGTGAVKITPAHDFNDFEVGRRHQMEQINVLDRTARITLQGNQAFLAHVRGAGDTSETDELINWTMREVNGLSRDEARKKIVARLEERGLLERTEPHTHAVPHGDRSDEILEPWLTDQWYLNVKPLAEKAIEAVERGETVFVPRSWEKTYFQWMRNIEPWCISRQLWWGHQIPAWYGRKEVAPRKWASIDGEPDIFVAATEAEAIALSRRKYGCEIRVLPKPPSDDLDPIFQQIIDDELAGKPRWEPIWRDPDVLDTWFSSQLWPFSTMGWPEKTDALARYYPTDVLVTAHDIIFFWVARMMMAGIEFMGEVPFKTVYIHALVRDEKGAKMSKSKGNVMDPLELIDEFGADALRMTLAAMAAQGRDIKLSKPRIEGYRNFVTKLWNAARFAEMNECKPDPAFDPHKATETLNRWILGETMETARAATEALDGFKFNEAAGALYRFVWNVYCDWYLELIKPVLLGTDEAAKSETRAAAAWVLDKILALLHPIMPFVTEELWAGRGARETMLILAAWPRLDEAPVDKAAMDEMSWLIELVSGIRSVRAEMNVPAGAQIPVQIVGANAESCARIARYGALAQRLARLSSLEAAPAIPPKAVQLVLGEAVVALPLEGIIDIEKEKLRLQREAEKALSEAGKVKARLVDANFVSRAPEEIIEENRERLADFEARAAKLKEALSRL